MTPHSVKNIKIEDFNYPLPDERIARHPLAQRDSCKLLVADPDGKISHDVFSDLPSLLPHDSVMVCNDTRVINARISFRKPTGSKIEVFLLEPLDPEDYVLVFQSRNRCSWSCLVGNLKRWKEETISKELLIEGKTVTLTARRGQPRPGNAHEIEFIWDDPSLTFASIVDAAGYIPIPPYLKRDTEETDTDDYQTVYARFKGSVAAPTAGLHFTPDVFDALRAKGITIAPLTLHVGAGTFQPVKSEKIGDHPMHTETFTVSRDLIRTLIEAKESGKPITAVGTTSVRTLESLPYLGAALETTGKIEEVRQWWPYDNISPYPVVDTLASLKNIDDWMDKNNLPALTAATSIMIAPGFKWRIVDNIITNFHQPESTLLLLVSSFLDREEASEPRWRKIYNIALAENYRFLSYGDACLFMASKNF